MSEHRTELLGAWALGVLEGDEWAETRAHLEECALCRAEAADLRATEKALGGIPSEVFLAGSPAGGDLLLRRTLHDVRGERRSMTRRGLLIWFVCTVAVVAVAIAGGLFAGRRMAASVPSSAPAFSSRTVTATDARTGATMTVLVQAANGWVKVHATIGGVPAGTPCRLTVVARDGSRRPTGSWLAGPEPVTVDSAALMAPGDVSSVDVENYAGEILVSGSV